MKLSVFCLVIQFKNKYYIVTKPGFIVLLSQINEKAYLLILSHLYHLIPQDHMWLGKNLQVIDVIQQ